MYMPTINWTKMDAMTARLAIKHGISELHALKLVIAAQETAGKEATSLEEFRMLFPLELSRQFDGLQLQRECLAARRKAQKEV